MQNRRSRYLLIKVRISTRTLPRVHFIISYEDITSYLFEGDQMPLFSHSKIVTKIPISISPKWLICCFLAKAHARCSSRPSSFNTSWQSQHLWQFAPAHIALLVSYRTDQIKTNLSENEALDEIIINFINYFIKS